MARQKAEAGSESLKQEDAFNVGEIGDQGPVKQAAERDINMAAFMEELVTIQVHDDGKEGALDVIIPVVNGINQPIIRGREQKIKRKYVEVLARGRLTTYDQRVQNPAEPSNIQMVPKTVLAYPFAVIRDPNPKGRPWLKSILDQP